MTEQTSDRALICFLTIICAIAIITAMNYQQKASDLEIDLKWCKLDKAEVGTVVKFDFYQDSGKVYIYSQFTWGTVKAETNRHFSNRIMTERALELPPE